MEFLGYAVLIVALLLFFGGLALAASMESHRLKQKDERDARRLYQSKKESVRGKC